MSSKENWLSNISKANFFMLGGEPSVARLSLDGFNVLYISAVPRINNPELAELNIKPAFTI